MSVRHPTTIDDTITGVALAAGTANVIMQLSWPEVGYGVVESKVDSGKATLHPIKRSRTTFTYLAVAVWGSDEERRTYRKAINSSHRHVKSDENSPVKYNAFHTDLQLWVAACLYRGLEDVHRGMYPDSNFLGDNGIYEECRTLATTLQVTDDMWPADRDAFETYWKEGLDRVSIDGKVRDHLNLLVDLKPLPVVIARPFAPLHKFFVRGFLHPEFREQMQYSWTAADQRRFDTTLRSLGAVNERLPKVLRALPMYAYLNDFRIRQRMGWSLV